MRDLSKRIYLSIVSMKSTDFNSFQSNTSLSLIIKMSVFLKINHYSVMNSSYNKGKNNWKKYLYFNKISNKNEEVKYSFWRVVNIALNLKM